LFGVIAINRDEAISDLRAIDGAAKDTGASIGKSVEDGSTRADTASKGWLGRFGDGMARLGQIGLGLDLVGRVAQPFIDFIGAGVQGVHEAEDASRRLDAVITSTGNVAGVSKDKLLEYANALQETTKFSAETVNAAQGMLLTFTNISAEGGIFDRATQLTLDMAEAMGTDASNQAIQLGKALNDPIKGVSALSRVGVQFTADQKEQIKAMVEAGNTAGAQTLILDELAKQFGGMAVAAGETATGQMVRFQNSLGEVGESIAATFMPILADLLSWFVAQMPAIRAFVEEAMVKVGAAFEFVRTQVIPPLTVAFDAILPVVSAVFTAVAPILAQFGQVVSTAFTLVKTLWDSVLKPVLDLLSPAFNAVFSVVVTVVGTAFKQIENALKLVTAVLKGDWQAAWDAVKAIFTTALTGLTAAASAIWAGIKGVFANVLSVFTGIGRSIIDGLSSSITGGVGAVVTAAQGAWAGIKGSFSTALAWFTSLGEDLPGNLARSIRAGVAGVVAAANGVWAGIKGAFRTVATWFLNIGEDLVDGLVKGVLGGITRAVNSVKELGTSIVGGLKDLLGIKSPSTVFASIGEDVVAGLEKGLSGIAQVLRAIQDPLAQGLAELASLVQGTISSIAKGDFVAAIAGVVTSIIGAFTRASEAARKFKEEVRGIRESFTLLDPSNLIKTTTKKDYLFGFIPIGSHQEVDQAASSVGLSFARALEGGVIGGLTRGMRAFINGEADWREQLRAGLRDTIISGIIDALLQGAVFKGLLGDLLASLSAALAANDMEGAQGIITRIGAVIPQVIANIEKLVAPLRDTINAALPMPAAGGGGGGLPTVAGGDNRIVGSIPVAPVIVAPAQPEWVERIGTYFDSFGGSIREFSLGVREFRDVVRGAGQGRLSWDLL
jgi:phage-related protein